MHVTCGCEAKPVVGNDATTFNSACGAAAWAPFKSPKADAPQNHCDGVRAMPAVSMVYGAAPSGTICRCAVPQALERSDVIGHRDSERCVGSGCLGGGAEAVQ